MDIGKRIVNPEETLPALISAVFKQKKANHAYGEFLLHIVFKDGKPSDVKVSDTATFKFQNTEHD